MDVQAYQHIYANVEKEQSPTARGGFQTLFYSRAGLTEVDVEEIEARVLYYPSEDAPVKQVFFRTPVGNVVVGQVVPLPEPDSAGRGGRYLAHCFIFTPEAFARIDGDPFRVLAAAPFVTTVEGALALGDMATGDIPAAALCMSDIPCATLEGTWPKEMLKRLVLAGLQAERMAEGRKLLAIVGTPEETRAVLRTAMLAVPTARRGACPFDTYFYRCNPVATYCWAVGLPEAPPNPNYLAVECAKQSVDAIDPSPEPDCYERWVLAALHGKALTRMAPGRNQAAALCAWLDGGELDPAVKQHVDSGVLESVFTVCGAQVEALARRRLGQALGVGIADRLVPIWLKETAATLFAKLTTSLDTPALLDQLMQGYTAARFATPAPAELAALGTLLAQHDHRILRFWHAYWAGTPEEVNALLSGLPDDQYRVFVKHALAAPGANPARMIARGHGETFLTFFCASDHVAACDLAAIAEGLVSVGAGSLLERLRPYIPNRSRAEIRALQALVKRRPEILESFRLEVEDAVKALPKENGGIIQFVKGLFKHK